MASSKTDSRLSIRTLLNDDSSEEPLRARAGAESSDRAQVMTADRGRIASNSRSSSSPQSLVSLDGAASSSQTPPSKAEEEATAARSRRRADETHAKDQSEQRKVERWLLQRVEAHLLASGWQKYEINNRPNRKAAKRIARKEDLIWTSHYLNKLFFITLNLLKDRDDLESIIDAMLARFTEREGEIYEDLLPRENFLHLEKDEIHRDDLAALLPSNVPEGVFKKILAAQPKCPKKMTDAGNVGAAR